MILCRLPHIYPGRVPGSPGVRAALGFFNETAHSKPSTLQNTAFEGPENRALVWLFLVSPSDLNMQRNLLGEDFAKIVSDRLADARQQGRQPILIAPHDLLDDVKA